MTKPAEKSSGFRLLGVVLTTLLAAAIFLLGQLASVLLLELLVPGFSERMEDVTPWHSFGVFVAFGVVVTGLLHLVLNKHHKDSIRYTLRQLSLSRLKGSHIGPMLGLQFLYFVTSAVFILLLQLQDIISLDGEQSISFDRAIEGAALIPAFLTLVVLAPIIEELLFRGFLYQRLRKLVGVIAAAAVTSLLFGSAHIWGGDWQIIVAVDTAILSVYMIIAFEKTKTLLVPIIMHAVKNSLAFYVLFIA